MSMLASEDPRMRAANIPKKGDDRLLMWQVGGDLETHVSIQPCGFVVHGPKNVARFVNVRDRHTLVDAGDRKPFPHAGLDLIVVFVALGDRLLERGGIGRHAAEAFLRHATRTRACANPLSRQVVEPVALTVIEELT
jgi:hypothetical protein